jgi:phospholipid/cholesterol/gamma-HCH transport system substrate-binding protein
MEGTRERALVGLFVVLAAALLFGSVLAISGGMGGAGVEHRAYFKYSGGVQAGAPVRFGGMMVGKVNRVRVDPANTTRIEIDFVIDRATPVKTDSVAKITTLGPLSDNYIEISTGGERSPSLAPGADIPSTEMFGLPQLGESIQAMLPDVQHALLKVNTSLDGLQVTLARANDLLNDRNRATIAHSLATADRMLAETRPKLNASLDNVNMLLGDVQPKVSASLTNVQEVTAKLLPLLDDIKKVSAQANVTLSHVDATLMENRSDVRTTVVNLRDALAKSTVLLGHLNRTLDQNSDNIDELLENVRISTQNLKELTETLRSQPASLIRGAHAEDRQPGGSRK